jgi:hypothetical protein
VHGRRDGDPLDGGPHLDDIDRIDLRGRAAGRGARVLEELLRGAEAEKDLPHRFFAIAESRARQRR